MREINLKSNMYAKRSASILNNSTEKYILNIIFFSFGAFALLYILFLGNMVKNIIDRRSFEIDARSLSSEVQNLEVTYLSMSNNIDLAFSYSMGFKSFEETKTTFATRKSLSYVSKDKPLSFEQSEPFGNIKIVQNDL